MANTCNVIVRMRVGQPQMFYMRGNIPSNLDEASSDRITLLQDGCERCKQDHLGFDVGRMALYNIVDNGL